MSRSYARFKKDLLARVRQNSSSTGQESKLLLRKFKYFDREENSQSTFADFSNVINRLNVMCASKNEEFEIFSLILNEQKEKGVVREHSKEINYVEFVYGILEIKRSGKSQKSLRMGEGSNRNNGTSQMMSVVGSRHGYGDVTTTQFEKSLIIVSEGMCDVNLLFVLQHLNKEIKRGMGNRQIDYKGLLKCFMKIGLGFKYEVGFDFFFNCFKFFVKSFIA